MLREQLVLLDVDLADLYGVSSKCLRELVWQNQTAFSVEFAFTIKPNEIHYLKSQLAAKYPYTDGDVPLAFTEHGVIMAAHALNSPDAVQTSIRVVRAFVKRREETPSNSELGCRIAALEKSISMLDTKIREQFEAIYRAVDKRFAPPASNMRSNRKLN